MNPYSFTSKTKTIRTYGKRYHRVINTHKWSSDSEEDHSLEGKENIPAENKKKHVDNEDGGASGKLGVRAGRERRTGFGSRSVRNVTPPPPSPSADSSSSDSETRRATNSYDLPCSPLFAGPAKVAVPRAQRGGRKVEDVPLSPLFPARRPIRRVVLTSDDSDAEDSEASNLELAGTNTGRASAVVSREISESVDDVLGISESNVMIGSNGRSVSEKPAEGIITPPPARPPVLSSSELEFGKNSRSNPNGSPPLLLARSSLPSQPLGPRVNESLDYGVPESFGSQSQGQTIANLSFECLEVDNEPTAAPGDVLNGDGSVAASSWAFPEERILSPILPSTRNTSHQDIGPSCLGSPSFPTVHSSRPSSAHRNSLNRNPFLSSTPIAGPRMSLCFTTQRRRRRRKGFVPLEALDLTPENHMPHFDSRTNVEHIVSSDGSELTSILGVAQGMNSSESEEFELSRILSPHRGHVYTPFTPTNSKSNQGSPIPSLSPKPVMSQDELRLSSFEIEIKPPRSARPRRVLISSDDEDSPSATPSEPDTHSVPPRTYLSPSGQSRLLHTSPDHQHSLRDDSDSTAGPDPINDMATHMATLKLVEPQQSLAVSDLTEDFKDLRVAEAPATPLDHLLSLSSCNKLITIDEFLSKSEIERKLGEASYSEVFALKYILPDGRKVPAAIKIIPFQLEKRSPGSEDDDDEENDADEQMLVDDVVKEVKVMKHVREAAGDRFVDCYDVGVCQGAWPDWLLDIRDAWTGECENERPDKYPPTQLHALLILRNGGTDLEHMPPRSAAQVLSITRQIVSALARAETSGFEHRDLHWGNVLVSFDDDEDDAYDEGVKVCIIDFTFGRINDGTNAPPIFNPITDPAIFAGKGKGQRGGDLQFDVYRWMLAETGGAWVGFYPRTNIFWIHYLIDKLLTKKKLAKQPAATGARKILTSLRDAILECGSASEAVDRGLLDF
ncbi:hypothetical protein DFS34DRAFT_694633 [Phlyctochytrium arcticum]|nr:hypothetical protein DFS34DRAFT_694633 [Phlyctochytrium arcticum]